jgi:NAD-dependent deacetylase
LLHTERDVLSQARDWIHQARNVAILTGAGVSQESGVPVFRGPQGLWRNFLPEELATPEAFARDPRLVWEWYDWRRSLIARAEPNAAHYALAQLERRKKNVLLITQNVDGLHDRAGSARVVKLHGDIWQVRCVGCGREERNTDVPMNALPPRCSCGALIRPGVVWFGESPPRQALEQAFAAAREADVFLAVGTSAVVYPAAALPGISLEHGATVIEINLEPTALTSSATLFVQGKAGEILPKLISEAA